MPEQKPEQTIDENKAKLTDRTDDLWESSEAAQSLERMRVNPRIKYVVICVP